MYPRDDPEYQKKFNAIEDATWVRTKEASKEKEEAYRIYAQKRDYYDQVAWPALLEIYYQEMDALGQQFGLPARKVQKVS